MSAPNKSFFSGLHLLVTGMAALVTASAAVFGIAVNQGWLSSKASTPTSAPPGNTATTAAIPQYAIDPTSLAFQTLGPATLSVKVTNVGVVPLTVETPAVTGPDASRFTVAGGTCSGSVDPGRSCQVQVAFKHAAGSFTATLVIQVTGAARATEVPITATAVL